MQHLPLSKGVISLILVPAELTIKYKSMLVYDYRQLYEITFILNIWIYQKTGVEAINGHETQAIKPVINSDSVPGPIASKPSLPPIPLFVF